MELRRYEILANLSAVADVLVQNVHKKPSWALSRKEGMGQNPSLSVHNPAQKNCCNQLATSYFEDTHVRFLLNKSLG